jgi:superfamily II DNA/RNA helicase
MYHLLIAQQTRNNCHVLILEPSRELAANIAKLVNKLGEFMQAQCVAYIGDPCVRSDVHIAVGTPGRVCDMIHRRALRVDSVSIVVLDDADEMLSRGWKDLIYEVLKSAPQRVQVCLFSRTVPVEAHSIMSDFMREPVRIFKARDTPVSLIEVSEIAPLCHWHAVAFV